MSHRKMLRGRGGRNLHLIALAIAFLFAGASPAMSINSIVSIDFGQPKGEIATIVKARVVSDAASNELYVKIRATGGPACLPTAAVDPGTYVGRFKDGFIEGTTFPVGDTTQQDVVTFTAGTYQWCAWLANQYATAIPVATASGILTVATPIGAISSVAVPAVIPLNQTVVATVAGATEVTRQLIWRLRPLSEPPCALAPALDQGSARFDSVSAILGNFSSPIEIQVASYGQYRLCLWVARDRSAIEALGVNETVISVPAPPSPATSIRFTTLPARIKYRALVSVRARVTSQIGVPKGVCHVQRFVARRWSTIARGAVASNGYCSMVIRIGRIGREQVKVVFVAKSGSGFVNSETPYRNVRVVR